MNRFETLLHEAGHQVRQLGREHDLLERIRVDLSLRIYLCALFDPASFIGRLRALQGSEWILSWKIENRGIRLVVDLGSCFPKRAVK